jgi:hypothetical protein
VVAVQLFPKVNQVRAATETLTATPGENTLRFDTGDLDFFMEGNYETVCLACFTGAALCPG